WGHERQIGPKPWFRIEGAELSAGPGDEPLGRFENHQWKIEEQCFTSFTLDDASSLRFEDPNAGVTRGEGPFGHLRFADGTLYADDTQVATFDFQSAVWRSFADGK